MGTPYVSMVVDGNAALEARWDKVPRCNSVVLSPVLERQRPGGSLRQESRCALPASRPRPTGENGMGSSFNLSEPNAAVNIKIDALAIKESL